MQILFYISLFIIVFTYILYPLGLFFLTKKRVSDIGFSTKFDISIIIPAYNEIEIIEEKVNNTIAICGNYNAQIILVSDGSTDETERFTHPQITHLYQSKREGKPAAINRALKITTGEIIFFTDANTILSDLAIEKIGTHFVNAKVGAVCGEKAFNSINKEVGVEHIYWQLESKLKQAESNYNTVVGAAGELFAIRTELMQPLPENMILDDFYVSMQVAKRGYIITYEPEAKAMEQPSLHLKDEYKRRTRMASGVMQWLIEYGFKDFWKYNLKLKWQFFSHRFCRWILAPLAFVGILISCLIMGKQQVMFYYFVVAVLGLSLVGYLLYFFKIYFKIFYFPFYFIFVHICFLIGYVKYFLNKHTILWDKARRS
jgi:poly-beta-1,6-N-acetyl-D-glucosamine synthase